MTFKHAKFADSPIMRSLEKVAQEKGLIRPDELKKEASIKKKADITPTNNLMENIFKLCAGLREQGLVKEATEIEANYLQFKQAQTLYETSKEEGEDQVHAAHPDGSHKLENVDSDEAVVEDILDQHDKIIEVMNKTPKGKLASSTDVLNAVKVVLGALPLVQAQDKDSLLSEIVNLQNQARNKVNQAIELSQPEAVWPLGPRQSRFEETLKSQKIDALEKSQSVLEELTYRLKPGIAMGITKDTWVRVSTLLGQAANFINAAIEKRKSYNTIVQRETETGTTQEQSSTLVVPEVKVQGDPLSGRLGNLVAKLQSFMAIRSVVNNPEAKQWITEEMADIKTEQKRIESVPQEQRAGIQAQLENDIAAYEQEVSQFYNDWVNVKPRA